MERKYNQGVADSNRKRVRHGGTVNARQGGSTSLYKVWSSIKDRCFNLNSKHYHRYGGRGVIMCKSWAEDYAKFAADVGDRPENTTLDRIDNNGHYEPNNVRWATRQEQANNRVTNVVVTYEGLTMTLADWARHKGWKYGLLTSRWKKGLRGGELFAPPEYERGKLVEFRGELRTLPEWVEALGVNYQTLRWRLNNGKPLL